MRKTESRLELLGGKERLLIGVAVFLWGGESGTEQRQCLHSTPCVFSASALCTLKWLTKQDAFHISV